MPVRASVNDEKLCSVAFADVFGSVAEYENTTPYYYDTEKKKQESVKKTTYTVVKRSGSGNEDGTESSEGKSTTARSGDQRTRIGLNDLMKESGRKG